MKNIINQNVAELARWIIVIKRQKSGICFFDKEILVWDLFSPGFFYANASPLKLESSWYPKAPYCLVLLNGIVRKGHINFLEIFRL